ncbi:hypothetical protein [Shewanella pealeana]|uniref:Uncharacterized protein n=1 Tax=Shewanella pealeana (strain ATCC 700345 / ANG-SQ1) TaxID=398579 RepID=A8H2T9_SHEPA|nr:hypothetical protein [Shewanella pealeana]ABV86876.1 hypothetical protein Spea_1551 [Shewanella pealeana ATCC 700345]
MRVFYELWFWFGLIICPIIFIASVFNTGRLLGHLIYRSEPLLQALSTEPLELVASLSLVICTGSEFYRAFNRAKERSTA